MLGASNVTRMLPVIVATLRATFPRVRIFVAHGHGRSYGDRSRLFNRELDGHTQGALWDALDRVPDPAGQRFALVTDVGNDVVYGHPIPQIITWVDTCLRRLEEHGFVSTLTAPPLQPVLRLSERRYRRISRLFFPAFDLPYPELAPLVRLLDAKIRRLAADRGVALAVPDPRWFVIDPIHVRYLRRIDAMREYLGKWPGVEICPRHGGYREAARLWNAPPQRKWVQGQIRTAEQPTRRTADHELWLF